jgi:hypothetical protein
MEAWTDEHARLVAEAAPAVPDTDLDAVWSAVDAQFRDDAPARRSRKLNVIVGGGLAAVVVGVAGAAAAGVFSAHTGRYPSDAEDLRLGGPGEKLDMAGADFREAVDGAIDDIPFPSAKARERSVDVNVYDQQRNHPKPGTEFVSTGAIRAWTAVHAVCAWSDAWVVARRSGDASEAAAAKEKLLEARHWPAITDIDPVQQDGTLTQEVTDASGGTTTETIADPTQFYYLRLLAGAVERDDVSTLTRVLSGDAYCPGMLPHLPGADPDFGEPGGR